MKKLFVILSLFVYVSCIPVKETKIADCCQCRLKKELKEYSLRKLGKEYRYLKNNAESCCEKYGSGLHKIMQQISFSLDSLQPDSVKIIRALGLPDATTVPSQYGKFVSGNEKIMIYCWRKWHDFLYVITENGKTKKVKWFYAYE